MSHAFTSPFEEILKVYAMMKLLVRRCLDMSLCQLLCPEVGCGALSPPVAKERELVGSVIELVQGRDI